MKRQRVRRTRWVAGGVMAVTAIAVAGLVWVTFLMPPSKVQFTAARDQAQELKTSVSSMNQANRSYLDAIIASLSLTPDGSKLTDETKQAREGYEELYSSYQSQLKNLLRSPTGRDSAVKKQLDTLSAKSRTFETFMTASVRDYPVYFRARLACDQTDQILKQQASIALATEYLKHAGDCQAALGTLSKVSFGVMAAYGKEASRQVEKVTKAYEQLKRDGNLEAATTQLQAVRQEVASLDPVTDLETARMNAVNTTELDALITLLNKKASDT